MKIFLPLNLLIVAGLLLFSMYSYAGDDDHGDQNQVVQQQTGPFGGKLLTDGGFNLEITIYETGIPAEMRIYAYEHDELITGSDFEVFVMLNRLGGEQERLSFKPELNYWVSEQTIPEPHSYDVTVAAVHGGKRYQWTYQNYEGRTTISDRQIALAGIKTDIVSAQNLPLTEELFGVIAPVADQVYRINTSYPGIVEKVLVNVGDKVKKGQALVTLSNSNTLQRYTLTSPANAEVTKRLINPGDKATAQVLLELADYSQVWVEMSAFPESIEKLAVGQAVTVTDLHHHLAAKGEVSYLAPQMTDGHIARARTLIDNSDGHWRPGMHVRATVVTQNREVPMAIKTSALQLIKEMPVVFARYGNSFEVRMLELGEKSGDYQEVLGGIKPGTEYVTENSFLIKADVMKSGASHDH